MMLIPERNAYLATVVVATLFIAKKIRWMFPESRRLRNWWCRTALSSWRSIRAMHDMTLYMRLARFGKNTREAKSRSHAESASENRSRLRTIECADAIRTISNPRSSAMTSWCARQSTLTNATRIWNIKRGAKSPLEAPRRGERVSYWLRSVIL